MYIVKLNVVGIEVDVANLVGEIALHGAPLAHHVARHRQVEGVGVGIGHHVNLLLKVA